MKLRGIDNILVTGGAGFIGSHIVDLLVDHGYDVTILDNLKPQAHGKDRRIPEYVNKKVNFVKGDIRNHALLKKLMKDADAVIHLATIVGVGQSMYQIERYVDTNTRGTANILDVLVNEENDVKKLLIASASLANTLPVTPLNLEKWPIFVFYATSRGILISKKKITYMK